MILLLSLLVTLALEAPQTPTAPANPPRGPSPAATTNPVVVITTSRGDITVELFQDRAPVSVANFLQYASEGFYEGTIFHRVVPNFVIQGGGFTAKMEEKATHPPIQNESTNGLRNVRGTLSMARTRALRSATSQFYINLADNALLDHRGFTPDDFGYAVFGRVIAGMDVVDAVGQGKTTTVGPYEDVPVEPVLIRHVAIKQ
jgi:cyclophilin family peptidyl-prolyl cis-trans isomerase